MSRSCVRLAVLVATLGPLLVFSQTGMGQVATLVSTQDTTLFQDPQGALSSGSGNQMFVGLTVRTNLIRRAALAFDLASLPSDAVITGASLSLYMTRNQAGDSPINFHRVLQSWSEGASVSAAGQGVPSEPGDATWIHSSFPSASNPGTLWTTPGGTINPSPSLSAPGIFDSFTFMTFSGQGLVADLNAWLANPTSNFGWLLRGIEEPGFGARAFATREASNPAERPTLTITYIPTPSTSAIFALAYLAAGRRRR
jgi:hypothetical protein